MKHSVRTTLVLVGLFLASQYIGLAVVDRYVDVQATQASGSLTYRALPSVAGYQLERPELEAATSFVWIIAGVLVATVLILLLIRWRSVWWWRAWFFLAVSVCLTIAFGAFVPGTAAGVLAVFLAGWKVFRPGVLVHNFTELFVYAGLAALFVPVMDVRSVVVLLVLMSAYDAYAVWSSKHMVSMARFQTAAGVFSGLLIPYGLKERASSASVVTRTSARKTSKTSSRVRTAVLGGGDMGFPLLFTGVVMKSFGVSALVIPVFVALSLLGLLWFAEKGKFYPALPFLTAGCFVGWLIALVASS